MPAPELVNESSGSSPGEPSADEPVITVGADVHGSVIEVDAARWSHEVMIEAIRHQLMQIQRPVSLWVDNPFTSDAEWSALAEGKVPDIENRISRQLAEVGLTYQRDLFRMDRSLPMSERTDIVTRAFIQGIDDEAWLAVNNRAFRGHREQGGWTLEMLTERQAEPWFDPEGFRIYESDGEICGFCWTKTHTDETPVVGEVYAVAVDPEFHGRGLGRALTLAGYQHLESVGITRAMLYVDADNTPAVSLYRSLGLQVTVVRRLFTD